MATGNRVLAEALCRRLTTAPGQLGSDPNYGFDLRSLISEGVTDAELARIPSIVRNEALKDQRVRACATAYTYDRATRKLTLAITVTAGSGPFPLTISISSVSVALLTVGAATS